MWYDILTLAILGYCAIRGAMKGFVWQVAAIGALILCFAFAEPLSLVIAPSIALKPPANRWVAMLGIYLLFSFFSFSAARNLRRWIEKARFVEYDRHLGTVFGVIKGGLICLVLTFFAVTLSESARAAILQSHSGYIAAIVMDRLHPVMPAELHDILEPYIHQLDRPGMDLHHGPHGHEPSHGHNHNNLGDHHASHDHEHSSGGLDRKPAGEDDAHFENPHSPHDRQRLELLREITAIYADFPAAQTALLEQVEQALAGLPHEVARAVIEDWYSDLLTFGPDPDPTTTLTTPLDTRILNQLNLARVPVGSLKDELQVRLRESQRR